LIAVFCAIPTPTGKRIAARLGGWIGSQKMALISTFGKENC